MRLVEGMRLGHVLVSAAIIWCLTLFIMLIFTLSVETNLSEAEKEVGARYQDEVFDSVPTLRSQLSTIARENDELRYANSKLVTKLKALEEAKRPPSLEHERLRRKLELDVRELGYYVQSQIAISMDILKEDGALNVTRGAVEELTQTIDNFKGHLGKTMSDFKSFGELDKEWREEISKSLGKIVQTKIHQIMNPDNCQEKKIFLCDFEKTCGFGCQLHHAVYCLLTAIYNGRPLVLVSKRWKYSPEGWEKVFKPISETCQNVTFNSSTKSTIWRGDDSVKAAWIAVAEHGRITNTDYFPLTIPEELAPDLVRLHGNPAVWWIGQLTAYLWRPQPVLARYIDDIKKKIGFKTPIVGVQVRRTDKIDSEAALHHVEDYMNLVDEYYNERELREKVHKRRVYLATDDINVVHLARKIYPRYEILNDPGISESAGTDTRSTLSGLLGVATDIQLLAQSDFLVCTFSSNVCRVAYELMQAMHGDASQKFRSLDDVYYFGGQNKHYVRAIQRHVPRGGEELALIPGDKIHLFGNHWNGYSKGRHKINRKVGLFPSYKVEETVPVVKFPVKFLQVEDKT